MTWRATSGRPYDGGATPGDAVASYNVPGYLRPAGSSHLTPTEDIRAMVEALPASDVAAAYLLGQRNAMESAFQDALPQRQMLVGAGQIYPAHEPIVE